MVRDLTPKLAMAGLWVVAVAQPLFDLIARNPEFLVAHRAGRGDIFALAAGLVLAGPLALWAVVWLAGVFGRRAREAAIFAIIALLTALLAAQVASRLGASAWTWSAPVAIASGLAAAWAWRRLPALRTFTAVLSIGVVIAPAVFLTRPTMRKALAWRGGGAQPRGIDRVPPPAGSRADTPVVLAVLDEMPLIALLDADQRIDGGLYPNLAAIARDGVWFRNATTVSDYTRWALPAIVTGKYPRPDLMPTAEDHPGTLFTLLAPTHHLESREGPTRLCPADLCGAVREPPLERAAAMADDLRIMFMHVVAPADLRTALPDLAAGWAGFGAMETRQERRRRRFARRGRSDREAHAASFIQGITERDRQPAFYFMHTLLPHYPHLDLPTGQRNGTRARIPAEVSESMSWTRDEWGVIQFQQRQLMQIGAVDRIVGQLVRRLEDEGLYDRALVIVTADHGTAFQPGTPRRSFSEETAPAIVRVPLIVKYPAALGVPGGTSDRNVEVIDIAPTVADVLGLRLSWEADGVSLLDASAPERPGKRIYHSSAHAVRTYGAEGPDAGPLLRRKLAIFDGAANPFRIPRPPRFGELVGRSLADVRVERGEVRITLDQASKFEHMNVRADPVPFDVAGAIDPPGRAGEPAFIAVAVNGSIRAVTRTWDSEPARWLATPPLDAWRDGPNDLQVFRIDEDARGIVLRRPRQ